MTPRRRRPKRTASSRLPWDEQIPTLDLHGETAVGARARADRWLRERRREGAELVRVVTGRGLHSIGAPVLPGEIADLLSALRGSVVARAEREATGGAFRVELLPAEAPRAGSRGRSASGGAGPAGAELRRRAEDSLAELGITPTPALLEAEMRRLSEGLEGA